MNKRDMLVPEGQKEKFTMRRFFFLTTVVSVLLLWTVAPAVVDDEKPEECTVLIAGKNTTADGSILPDISVLLCGGRSQLRVHGHEAHPGLCPIISNLQPRPAQPPALAAIGRRGDGVERTGRPDARSPRPHLRRLQEQAFGQHG